MTQSNPFGSASEATTVTGPEGDEAVVTGEETTDATAAEVDAAADVDVDVDGGTGEADETETVDAPPTRSGSVVKKGSATKKASTRPAVPEGYISPVAAAKKLSEHLTAKAHAAGTIEDDEEIEVRPQVVYSYIKNNGPTSKNPIKTYSEGGRDNLLKLDEFLAWWDEKDARVAGRKAAAKTKTKTPAAAPAEEVAENETPVTEAE